MIKAVRSCFQKYVTFSGRATRPEFWYFILFMFFGMIVMIVINSILFGPEIQPVVDADGNLISQSARYNDGRLGDLFLLICLLPWLAVTWRRMHDINKPGYLPFAIYVPGVLLVIIGGALLVSTPLLIIGGILHLLAIIGNIVWLATPSSPGANSYGPHPAAPLESVFE